MEKKFRLESDFQPAGDQSQAIEKIVAGLKSGMKKQTLLGVTGSGKTFVLANVIEKINKPTLVMTHNKTLAAQLYHELKEFFPDNAVEYFVSYYDYYQPEAYMVATDSYIEKDASINDEIELMRLSATGSLIARKDVIVVASVSCIYGLGSPDDYRANVLSISVGDEISRSDLIKKFIAMQYSRNEADFSPSKFRVRGDVIEVYTAYSKVSVRIEMFGDEIERIQRREGLTGRLIEELSTISIFPAKHFITSGDKLEIALDKIRKELHDQIKLLKSQGKDLEAHRIKQRTEYDMEMLKEMGYCNGIENYSRHIAGTNEGDRPAVLLDYFGDDWMVFLDESHVSLPQIGGMYRGDRSRKQNLVDFGFRLPSALDNRPLYREEFDRVVPQVVYMSATPGKDEKEHSEQIAELVIRPTGLVDPPVEVLPAEGQIDDLLEQLRVTTVAGYRSLVTTLTKKMSEDLTEFLGENGLRVKYLHSEIETIERVEILRDLRAGEFDILIGINLLREGLDLPEVGLVAILDADKAGFLRSINSLIQTSGRAARNVDGRVIMYADRRTDAMKIAIGEMERRREKQIAHNKKNGIEPVSVKKKVDSILDRKYKIKEKVKRSINLEKLAESYDLQVAEQRDKYIKDVQEKMFKQAENLNFEDAARLRDEIKRTKKKYDKSNK